MITLARAIRRSDKTTATITALRNEYKLRRVQMRENEQSAFLDRAAHRRSRNRRKANKEVAVVAKKGK